MYIFKISVAIMFIIIITAIAGITGILDAKYGSYIIFTGLAIQAIVLIIPLMIFLRRIKYRIK